MTQRDQTLRPPKPSLTGFLGDIQNGTIPLSNVVNMRAAVETVPGPVPDWRSLLVSESLKGLTETLQLMPTEAIVLCANEPNSKLHRRYHRAGLTPVTYEHVLQEAIGRQRYRRCLHYSTPKLHQASVVDFLKEHKKNPKLQWPVITLLRDFYKSNSQEPGQEHLVRETSRDLEALEMASLFWRRQRDNPIESRLGMPREAMAKLWRHEGGAWPSMAPNRQPKVIVAQDAELLHDSDIEALTAIDAAILFFGDPAIGIHQSSLEALRTLPLGSQQLEQSNTAVFGLGGGLSCAIEHLQRNGIPTPDNWMETAASLSGVALGGHREEFDQFRDIRGINKLAPRRPPVTDQSAEFVVSRYGIAGLERQLKALAGEAPPCKIEGSGQWKALLSQAIDVATVICIPSEEWPDKLKRRFPKGADAALFAWSHSEEKRVLIDLIHRSDKRRVVDQLKLLASTPYRREREVTPKGLVEGRPEVGDGAPIILKAEHAQASVMSNRCVALFEDADINASPADRAHFIYRQIAPAPVSLTADSVDALTFIQRSCLWLHVHHQNTHETAPQEVTVPRADAVNNEPIVETEYDVEVYDDDIDELGEEPGAEDAEEMFDIPPALQTAFAGFNNKETYEFQGFPVEAVQEEPPDASSYFAYYSDEMLEDAAEHEQRVLRGDGMEAEPPLGWEQEREPAEEGLANKPSAALKSQEMPNRERETMVEQADTSPSLATHATSDGQRWENHLQSLRKAINAQSQELIKNNSRSISPGL